jgi:serine/threonine protein phosphatase PrpC
MNTASAWRSGSATHPGLQRGRNEDRIYADDARGVYIVADGMGGHAAGEKAAEIAVEIIAGALDPDRGGIEEQVRRAITLANNEICGLSESHPAWRGMACVLTLAVLHGDTVTVGHVGDSRLYLIWNGTVRKLTPDHSPVGEREDFGELTEAEAMAHPRRHEVYRDVGSHPRSDRDKEFAEVRSFPFHPAAALLLSSDGLSDCLASADISAIVEQYDGDPGPVARALIEAANEQGGTDNISVVFIPGPEFVGVLAEARERHAITRARPGRRIGLRGLLWFAAGILVGILIGLLVH